MIRLSIIVPVYNVEKWLRRCLDSLFNQDIPEEEYEIIVVNDGTLDKSMDIVNEFLMRHSNIKAINRPNGGLSTARNTGLDAAIGRYVWFVDSDDWIEPNKIDGLLRYAEDNELDALGFMFQFAFEDSTFRPSARIFPYQHTVFSGDKFVGKVKFLSSPWATIYRKQYLDEHGLRFKEGILHEDEEFSPRAHYLCSRIAHTDTVVYNYFQREGSIMKSSKADERVRSFLSICDSLYGFMTEKVDPNSEAMDYFKRKLAFAFSQAVSHFAASSFSDIRILTNHEYYPIVTPQGIDKKMRIKLRLINHCLPPYIWAMRLAKNIKHK